MQVLADYNFFSFVSPRPSLQDELNVRIALVLLLSRFRLRDLRQSKSEVQMTNQSAIK